MFNRDALFGGRGQQQPPPSRSPQPPPGRGGPDPRYQRDPYADEQKGGYPQSNNMRAPPSSHQRPSSGGGRSIQLRPTSFKDNTFIFGNISAVSSQDIPPSHEGHDIYLLVNGEFVVSARPIAQFERGRISLSDAQRTWMQVALTDVVDVQVYDPFHQGAQSYLGAMDVEVGFAGKKSTDVPYDQDKLAQAFV